MHVLLLTGLGRLASVERLASALEVFTVEPAPEATTSTLAAPAARIARSVGPRPPRVPAPKSSVVQPAVIKPASERVVLPSPVITPPPALRDDLARGPEELQPAPAMPLTAAKTLTDIGPPPATVVARDAVVLQADTQLPSSPEHEPVAAPPPPATEPRNIIAAPADTSSPAEPRSVVVAPPTLSAGARRRESIAAPPTLSAAAESPSNAAPAPATATTSGETDVVPNVAAAPRSSTLGLGRLKIRLDGARERTTSREIDVISGTLIGGDARSLQVRVGDAATAPTLHGRAFSAAVSLKPGLNHVRVVASDAQGGAVEETLTVQYNTPISLAITSPPDGHTQTLDDPPLVVVHGEVDDPSVSSIWLDAGERRFAVPVTAGRFRHPVPVLEPTVRVRVETPPIADRSAASATVTVHGAATPTLALLLYWPSDAVAPVEVAAAWRPRADRPDGTLQRIPLSMAQQDKRLTIFYLRNPHPGVYTFVLRSPAGTPQAVQPALYVPGAGTGPRTLSPVTMDGSGRVVLARVLMPQGILWQQDDWFTGQSASGDTLTKFRFPDGISWTERIGTSP